VTWLEVKIQILKKMLTPARSIFEVVFLYLKGRRKHREATLHDLIMKITILARLVGKR
jgi:hypothetical protein